MSRLSTHVLRALVALLPAWAALIATAAEPLPTPPLRPGPLAPNTLQSIQRMGRAVLVAKKGETSDPELIALHQEMQGLATVLDQTMTTLLTTPPVARKLSSSERRKPTTADVSVTMTPTPPLQLVLGADGTFHEQPAAVADAAAAARVSSGPAPFTPLPANPGVPVGGTDPYVTVRQRMAQVQARLQQYRAAAEIRGGEARTIQAQFVTDKVAQLQAELQSALDDNSPQGGGRLAALRERLRPQSVAAVAPAAPFETAAEAPTPTLVTFDQHRALRRK